MNQKENNKGKGIIQQIEEVTDYETMDDITEEHITNFLEELISNAEYPDDMEIFTTDKGWHKVKDYR